MNVDLHCHSNASDGILNPNEVVKRGGGSALLGAPRVAYAALAATVGPRETGRASGDRRRRPRGPT